MQLSQKIFKLELLTDISLRVHDRENQLKMCMYWTGNTDEETAEVRELAEEIMGDLGLDAYVYYHNDDNGESKSTLIRKINDENKYSRNNK